MGGEAGREESVGTKVAPKLVGPVWAMCTLQAYASYNPYPLKGKKLKKSWLRYTWVSGSLRNELNYKEVGAFSCTLNLRLFCNKNIVNKRKRILVILKWLNRICFPFVYEWRALQINVCLWYTGPVMPGEGVELCYAASGYRLSLSQHHNYNSQPDNPPCISFLDMFSLLLPCIFLISSWNETHLPIQFIDLKLSNALFFFFFEIFFF